MAGDSIHMAYDAVLGPIDPQVQRNGTWVPALGYVEQYQRLIKKSGDASASGGPDLSRAEVAVLLSFDQAELYAIEQYRNLSVTLLKEWLVKYKFKNWEKRETSGERVTLAMKRERAEEIGNKLNDTSVWHSHGRGIPPPTIREELNLKVQVFEETPQLPLKISLYHDLLQDYILKLGLGGAVHAAGNFIPLL